MFWRREICFDFVFCMGHYGRQKEQKLFCAREKNILEEIQGLKKVILK